MSSQLVSVLFFTYSLVRQVRYSLLHSFFGFTIHCKHTESCGSYFFRQLRERGVIIGSFIGLRRVLLCW